jgi:hypothetical protein
MHTLKYKAVVGISSGKLLNLAGPFCGSLHDSSIFQNTLISNWLTEKNGFLLGDKGYIDNLSDFAQYFRKLFMLLIQ